MPFSRGKTRFFFVLQSKERKGTKTNQKKQKINKFGGFRGQVRWPFGPPHLTLKPSKTKNKNKKKQNKKKTRRV